jgi:hypothetical protein
LYQQRKGTGKYIMSPGQLKIFAWSLAVLVASVSVYVWGSLYDWRLTPLSNYQLFPLFGLLGFSLMWSHYIVAALRKFTANDRLAVKGYFELTSAAVLVSILLHPSLLIGQLFIDGHGLPPKSYSENYVAPGMSWVVLVGLVSLCAFLIYELRYFFRDRPWWKYVQYASDLAILAIFYHGLRLGIHLQVGWFRSLWFFYGATLLAAIVYIRFFNKEELK